MGEAQMHRHLKREGVPIQENAQTHINETCIGDDFAQRRDEVS